MRGGECPQSALDLMRWAQKELPAGKENEQTLEWMLREGEGEKLETIAAEANVPAPRVRQRVSRLRRYYKARWAAQTAAVAALLLCPGHLPGAAREEGGDCAAARAVVRAVVAADAASYGARIAAPAHPGRQHRRARRGGAERVGRRAARAHTSAQADAHGRGAAQQQQQERQLRTADEGKAKSEEGARVVDGSLGLLHAAAGDDAASGDATAGVEQHVRRGRRARRSSTAGRGTWPAGCFRQPEEDGRSPRPVGCCKAG